MKKEFVIVVIFTVCMISLLIFFKEFFNMQFNHAVDSFDKYIEDRSETEDTLLKYITFDDRSLIYDNSTNTYYLIVSNNNPTIKYRSYNKHVKVKFNTYITDNMIEKNEKLKMLIYTKDKYSIIDIVLTKLPIISINYDVIGDIYSPMDFKLYDNVTSKVVESKGKIRLRGALSKEYPKKSFRLSLSKNGVNNKVSLLNLRLDDDWILYSAYSDPEKVRNVFCSELWYETDNSGVRYKYVELFINGSYSGLYALGYPVDKKTVDMDDGYLYKKISWANPEITGEKFEEGYEIKEGPDNSFDALKKYYKDINSNDANLIKPYLKDNTIDIFLFYAFIQAIDNAGGYNLKNTYLLIEDNDVTYIPWDLDITFGNNYSASTKNYVTSYTLSVKDNTIMKINPVYRYMKLDKTYGLTIKERYDYLRSTIWSDENIVKLIDSYENDIYKSGAFIRDKMTWPDGDYNNPNVGLAKFKSYVLERLTYMDKYISDYTGIK